MRLLHIAILPLTVPVGWIAMLVGYLSAVCWNNYCQGYDAFNDFFYRNPR